MQAVLSNPSHSEYGVATIPLPIPKAEYDHCIFILNALEIGDTLVPDCKVEEISKDYPILKRLEGACANADELDYLVKRIESFDKRELAQFSSLAITQDIQSMKDYIMRRRGIYQQSPCKKGIKIHRRSRWYFRCALKALLLAAPQGAFYGLPFAWGLLLATRKRVYVFFECHLIRNLIFFQLVLNVFRDLFGVLPCRINVIPSAPKRSISMLVFQIPMPFVYH